MRLLATLPQTNPLAWGCKSRQPSTPLHQLKRSDWPDQELSTVGMRWHSYARELLLLADRFFVFGVADDLLSAMGPIWLTLALIGQSVPVRALTGLSLVLSMQ